MKYNSFAELAAAQGIKVNSSVKPSRQIKCRKCGEMMTMLEGTNIYACKCGNTFSTKTNSKDIL